MFRFLTKIRASIFAIFLTTALAGIGVSQNPRLPEKKPAPLPKQPMPATPTPPMIAPTGPTGTFEKSIMTDPRVSVSLCVIEGNVKINGWSRNEVRIFVREGSKVGFKVLQKSRQNASPVWVMALGYESKSGGMSPNECIWGQEIDIDVPTGASVSLKGKETTTEIDSIRKAEVRTVGGDIVARNIKEGLIAATYEGDVAIENVDGPVALESSSGNILAADVGPSQVGDGFRASTHSGAISLQRLDFRQIDVNSISGSVLFNGGFLSGGNYSFKTNNGSITLGLPTDCSAAFSASYGFGDFSSDVPLKDVKYGPRAAVKSLSGTVGGGEAKVILTTTTGRIALRRQQ